jgi:pyruvate,orthophosphate dikinase
MSKQWVFEFHGGKGKEAKALLGGKGANLCEMTKLGLPVPSGFVVSTEACIAYQAKKDFPPGLKEQILRTIPNIEQKSGKKFGDPTNPLLLSVRSGALISMPGMMDTVLNLGLTPQTVAYLAKNNSREFAFDSYRRFITMFSDVVMGMDRMKYEHILEAAKEKRGVKLDNELKGDDLEALCKQYLALYKKEQGTDFPTDPATQLDMAIRAVFDSWNNPRAIKYRVLNRIPHDLGTAVNVQEMVFGNMGDDCATGVAFTRHPSTGENARFGEYLCNAQGEDVVAGIRTPLDITEMKNQFPECSKQLYEIFTFLENHYKDMQDIEFTIERNKLYILQTRNGKRTGPAAVKMAVDMVAEGFIDKKTAVMRVNPDMLDSLLHPSITAAARKGGKVVGKGLPASPGAAVGQIVFSAEDAVAQKEAGNKVILVRLETSPEDISGMAAAEGILTARGGMTSHAAVVARGMNVPCIAGCSELTVNEEAGIFSISGQTFKKGEWITLDGTTGVFFAGKLEVEEPKVAGEFATFMGFAKEFQTMDVRANADTPHDAQIARSFGANGIGLCRTEHMFFKAERIFAVREMILANDLAGRQKALDKLLVFQRNDFYGLLKEMSGLPVIIRLLDPPLHEFLPHEDKEQQELANAIAGGNVQVIKDKVHSLAEFNPMLGFRGCRLGIVYPEINAMQVRAIFEASLQLIKDGLNPKPCIEIPLVGNIKEFLPLKKLCLEVAKQTGAEGKVHYEVGTMIEVPRAALRADELALEADFMSFGTNDLTQMTCGFSRDDSGSFLKHYVAQEIYARDPFQSVDQLGVGRLMRLCVSLARGVKPGVDIGICGEHGGEPESVEFCHQAGLNNVSCSPYRVPVAILAAAQAAIKYGAPKIQTPAEIFNTKSKL